MGKIDLRSGFFLFTCAVGVSVSMLYVYMMGPFIIALQAELGWTRSQVVSGLLPVSILSVIAAPLVGMGVDRFGSRPFALGGLILFCGAIAALSLATSVYYWFAVWLLLAVGSIQIKPTVWLTAIARRFTKGRGLAMGLGLSGTGLTAATVPLIATWLIDSFGWRTAFVGLGLGALAIVLPLALVFFRETDRGAAAAPKPAPAKGEIAAMMKSGLFVAMAASGFFISFAIMALVVHFVPILVSFSISPVEAAALASSIGIFSTLGRIVTGLLLDRFPAHLVGVTAFALPAIACAILLGSAGEAQILLFVAGALIGFSLGAEVDVLAFLAARYFGVVNYGTIFGTMMGVMSLALGVGPSATAMMFDLLGSYTAVLFVLAAASLVGMALIFSTRKLATRIAPVADGGGLH